MRTLELLVVMSLLPAAALADGVPALSCAQALEQIATLETAFPVYKLTAGNERHYIDDVDRPTEVAQLKKIVAGSCSAEPKAKASQQAEAQRLHVALSPECAVAHDELTAMERPNSHESADNVAKQRKLVADQCPAAETSGRWLLQWSGRSELQRDL